MKLLLTPYRKACAIGIDHILTKALSLIPIEIEEARTLLEAPPSHDGEIFAAAAALNEKLHGDEVTYVVNRNVNFTNICSLRCRFCAFSRSAGEEGAYKLSAAEVAARVAGSPDITEVCLQGGINERLGIDYYIALLREVKLAKPQIHIHAFSPQEIDRLAKIFGCSLERLFEILMENGLDSMPGTAAEIFSHDVRRAIAPNKISAARWAEIVKTAHLSGIRTTATVMFGHIEKPSHIANHLGIIRDIQLETGGFTEFIPLPFIPYKTPLARDGLLKSIPSQNAILKVYAVCRLFFGFLLTNLQASWVKLGVEGAARALACGANDYGGTLYEENITKSAGGLHGEYMSPADIRAAIDAAGKMAAQRDTLYNLIA